MIDIKKIKKDIINYGAIKLYEWTVSMVIDGESSEEDELFNAAQLKDIFKNQYDVLKLNIEMIDYETAEVVEFITKKFFKSNSIKSSNILNYSTHVDDQGVVTSLLFTLAGESISLNVSEVNVGEGGGGGASVQNVTYSELVELKAGALLVPGQLYRITDYQCTTTQKESRSAGHQFDIVVEALSESVLSEDAKAMLHAGDEYFTQCKLEAWELKYCLENDTSRFAWALDGQAIVNLNSSCSKGRALVRQPSFDGRNLAQEYSEYQVAWGVSEDVEDDDSVDFIYSKNLSLTDGETVYNAYETKLQIVEVVEGKGVIYFMKDEWNNECPYDFKNIQFRRYAITQCEKVPSLVGKYLGIDGGNGYTIDTEDFIWCFTFTWINENSEIEDCSIVGQTLANDEGQYDGVFNNKIASVSEYKAIYPDDPNSFQFALNNIVIQANYEYEDGVFYGIYGNKFGNNCFSNTFSDSCKSNIFGNNCLNNTFGNDCYLNTFGNDCSSNTFGDGLLSNTFGNNCSLNTFGSGCSLNTFGSGCSSNTFGSGCSSNTFGVSCQSNTFGSGCSSNIFGNSCSVYIFNNNCAYNTFGNNGFSNTFGSGCSSNTFGVSCQSNTFGNSCTHNRFGSACSSNTFDSSCTHNTFGCNCSSNTFGVNCSTNTFGDYSIYNTFGNNCSSNAFGDNCTNNTFGNDCLCNAFGNRCQFNIFGTKAQSVSTTINKVRHTIIENGCKYLDITTNDSTDNYLQNVHIHLGVAGYDMNHRKTLTVATRGNAFETSFKPANSVEIEVQ